MTHEPEDNVPENVDNEIKEAAEHFFDVVQNKSKKEAQKVLDAMTEEDIRNRLLQQAQKNLMQGSNQAASAIMVIKLFGADQSVIDVLVRQHAEVQAEVLRCLMPEDQPEDFVEQIAQLELDAIKDGLADHGEDEVGCLIAEYRRRLGNDDWADTLEVQGGVS